jgi:hypothetical protein
MNSIDDSPIGSNEDGGVQEEAHTIVSSVKKAIVPLA